MPSKSPKQRRTMAAAAHNPAFAKKVGIPVKVAKEFNKADTKKKRKKKWAALKKPLDNGIY
jgi:Holliday junction resolvase RusA-like endonuclease